MITLGSYLVHRGPMTIMKITKKNSIFSSVLVILIAALSFYFLKVVVLESSYSVDVLKVEPVYKLDVKTVIDLIKNEDKNFIEVEQVVEVNGIIKEINYLNNRITILLGTGNKESAHVICDMRSDQKEEVSRLNPNDTIKLKGVFKGFLADAIFLNCVITH